jgi:uncharacterized protein (TIGR01570 family)
LVIKKSVASNFLSFNSCVPSGKLHPSNDDGKNRLSFSLQDGSKNRCPQQQQQLENSESIIDPAASIITRKDGGHCTRIVGTIFGYRTGRVTFCVQRDAAVPPPFLFDLSILMQSLAAEMGSGLLRIAPECDRPRGSSSNANAATGGVSSRNVWKASCNGRDVGYATRRRPTEWDQCVLESIKTMMTGVVVPPPQALVQEGDQPEGGGGDVLYMRATTYETIVGYKDAVSYHLICPDVAGGSRPPQELSVFLLRGVIDINEPIGVMDIQVRAVVSI